MPSSKSSRRDVLRGAAALTAGAIGFPYIVSSRALGADGHVAPSNRIVMGVIGTGGQGTGMMKAHMKQPEVQMVAVCDVDTKAREQAKRIVSENYAKLAVIGAKEPCMAYGDFRELLARKDIDAVIVGTPDHWHGLVSIAAAKAGKDIYCEKPLVNVIAEGRAVCDAVKKYKRVLQCGSHERSGNNARYGCELVRNGRIGKLHTVRINLPVKDAHHKQVMAYKGKPGQEDIPDGFDWNFWVGPTPEASYSKQIAPFWWRFILAYGGGEMTDRGAHVIDLAQLGIGADDTGPVKFKAKGERSTESLYDTFMKYEFECEYANGVKMIGQSDGKRGLTFEGTEGWLSIKVHGGALEASNPNILKSEIKDGEIKLGRVVGGNHQRNFLDAVKSRGTPFASAEIGHRTATICHLLNIAMLTGKPLDWNPKTERITNDKDADKMINRPMRKPWHLPAKGLFG